MAKTSDYADTILLPRTNFPMRANLPELEPRLLARWDRIGLSEKRAALARARQPFTFHDGPPYANGPIHIGHVLNKTLKDVIHRSHWMLGLGSVFVPGWDCHGLPIEWRVEEDFRAQGRLKSDIPANEFRDACRRYAAHWLEVQSGEFKRLGVDALWRERYATMDFASEAQIIRELHAFARAGALYRASRPVLWSPVEQTALAEAEVEYEERTYLSIYARFPVRRSPHAALEKASLVIWTTTPWTLPGNRCIAFGPDIDYDLVQVETTTDGSLARRGERLVLARPLASSVFAHLGIASASTLVRIDAKTLAETICAHPLAGAGFDHDVAVHPGDFVTADQGSGFVHIAPACGLDDFKLGVDYGEPVVDLLDAGGCYLASVPRFAGLYVFDAHGPIAEAIETNAALLGRADHIQRYPHSWRSHAPLVYRATPQWFISLSRTRLRQIALAAIDHDIVWTPPSSRERIRSMVEQRPDWLISRQRVWGAPLALFVHKRDGELLVDAAVTERIAAAVEAAGAGAWFEQDASAFLGPDRDPNDFERVDDILDVWFDSGASFALSSEARTDTMFPASVVAEGSDQHRGYFQSSLLWSCGTRGIAPYRACLTHGFVMDSEGRKMSKSLGNVVVPQEVMQTYGADILRLWVVASDYSADLRVSKDILERHAETYRKLRNTLRFLLGNLCDYTPEPLALASLAPLERLLLHRLWELDAQMRADIRALQFHRAFAALLDFCIADLSALFFDVRKDVLYCEAPSSRARRATQSVLDAAFRRLAAWLAPFLPFTAEEAWLSRFDDAQASIHLTTFSQTPPEWRDDALAARFERALRLRRLVLAALETARNAKLIGSSLEADVTVVASDAASALDPEQWSELCLVASFNTADNLNQASAAPVLAESGGEAAVRVAKTNSMKCERCRRRRRDVGGAAGAPLCGRCLSVLNPG